MRFRRSLAAISEAPTDRHPTDIDKNVIRLIDRNFGYTSVHGRLTASPTIPPAIEASKTHRSAQRLYFEPLSLLNAFRCHIISRSASAPCGKPGHTSVGLYPLAECEDSASK